MRLRDDLWMNEGSVAAGNAMFVLPAIPLLAAIALWSVLYVKPGWARLAMLGLGLTVLGGVILRIGQWLLAQWYRVPPDRYADWSDETRAPITGLAGFLYTAGFTLFIWATVRKGSPVVWLVGWLGTSILCASIGYRMTPQ